MKVVILAAGRGSRLESLTEKKPKCMVEVKGKPIIDIQVSKFIETGISEDDICIVSGYKYGMLKDHFSSSNIHVLNNSEYETSNMVYSLVCASEFFSEDQELIISYGDIIFSASILKKVLMSSFPISICIDDNWKEYWQMRSDTPLSDAETLKYTPNGALAEIGLKPHGFEDIEGQYIGLMKFANSGLEDLRVMLKLAKNKGDKCEKIWRSNYEFRNIYMTDLLQGMIDEGYTLDAIRISREWFEIDCPRDLEIANKFWEE